MVKRYCAVVVIVFLVALSAPYLTNPAPANNDGIFLHVLFNTVRIIYSQDYKNIFGEDEQSAQGGSGILIGNDLVITCYHVLVGMPVSTIKIMKQDGKAIESRTDCKILKFDKEHDLLLIKVNPPFRGDPIKVAAYEPNTGEDIIFAGHNALQLPRMRFAKMLVSPKGIMLFPVYFGDSGGGVFNYNGELIGIVSVITQVQESHALHNTFIGYAIPLDILRGFLNG